jgi:hypothetical protein
VIEGFNIIDDTGQLQELDLRNHNRFMGQGNVKTVIA